MTLKNLLSLFRWIVWLNGPIWSTKIIISFFFFNLKINSIKSLLFYTFRWIHWEGSFHIFNLLNIYKKNSLTATIKPLCGDLDLLIYILNVNVAFFSKNAILLHQILYTWIRRKARYGFDSTTKTLKWGIECMSYFKHINYFAIKLYVLHVFQWFST